MHISVQPSVIGEYSGTGYKTYIVRTVVEISTDYIYDIKPDDKSLLEKLRYIILQKFKKYGNFDVTIQSTETAHDHIMYVSIMTVSLNVTFLESNFDGAVMFKLENC
jgi:hypothetical protein